MSWGKSDIWGIAYLSWIFHWNCCPFSNESVSLSEVLSFHFKFCPDKRSVTPLLIWKCNPFIWKHAAANIYYCFVLHGLHLLSLCANCVRENCERIWLGLKYGTCSGFLPRFPKYLAFFPAESNRPVDWCPKFSFCSQKDRIFENPRLTSCVFDFGQTRKLPETPRGRTLSFTGEKGKIKKKRGQLE